MSRPAVVLQEVSKTFDGVRVLHRVNLSIAPGRIHGLIGENGSGKSTLVKILAGAHTPDPGSRIFLHGAPVPLPVRHPRRHGLAIIHQDLALADAMTVADNVGICTGYGQHPLAPISSHRQARLAGDLAARLGLGLDPARKVAGLSPAERSVVAILRALRQLGDAGPGSVIILDEPTAALPGDQAGRLLRLLRAVAQTGTAVLYISHRLREVLATCDRVSVLRSGHLVATRDAAGVTEQQIASLMLGYDLGAFYPVKHPAAGRPVRLRVDHLTGRAATDVSFTTRAGQILGITGLVGMGQDEIPYLLAGGRTRVGGRVRVDGRPVDGTPRAAARAGLQLVPGNRQRDAFWPAGTATENLTLPHLHRFWNGIRLSPGREQDFTEQQLRRYAVRPPAPGLQITKFSGGNQQKIVLARALSQHPRVLLLHEPTQGVDAGAKKDILGEIRSAADHGAAVVVCSSDREEVAQLCHRVLIMAHGKIGATLTGDQVTEQQVLSWTQRPPTGQHGAADATR